MQSTNVALFSLKPKYAQAILDGVKQFEFRKTAIKENIEFILIYASSPVQKIVGIIQIEKIIRDKPKSLWSIAGKKGGISKEDYLEYFKGKEYGYALKIKAINKFERSVAPKKVFKSFRAPQSFMYVSSNAIENVLREVDDEENFCWWDSRRRQNDFLRETHRSF